MPKPVIFAGMPHYGPIEMEAAQAFLCLAKRDEDLDVLSSSYGSSLLAHAFNMLWCAALNARKTRGVTHFAMLHADIAPEPGWLSKLLSELQSHRADLVSAVVPIKSVDGVTSTAIDGPRAFDVERRLTMAEIVQLPETFDAGHCGFPDRTICANTGCWIADITKPWADKVHFQILNAIEQDADGNFEPKVFSEDWDFSRQIHKLGGKVMATRKVALRHLGRHEYGNQTGWGTKAIDHMAAGKPLPTLVS